MSVPSGVCSLECHGYHLQVEAVINVITLRLNQMPVKSENSKIVAE